MYIHFPLIVFEANAMNVMYNLVLYSQAIAGIIILLLSLYLIVYVTVRTCMCVVIDM